MVKIYPLLFVIIAFGCKDESFDRIQTGKWGGEHARLDVNETSWYVEFDCAHLEVNQPVLVQDGKFNSPALYTQEYPVQFDDESLYIPKPSRVFGTVKNKEMILNVEVEDQEFGTFTLIYDKEAKIYKCA
ncbi:hypothetical protein [Jiulongibacter sediminis]|jgi:hypothetical protein|uniref:hypothetical protein n=1 Tax=Jiulongibacter sediminis TaxID=1605367 RepID=UPI0026EE0F71|nr:hypothetical protein [Jiulongibacter sediminis]